MNVSHSRIKKNSQMTQHQAQQPNLMRADMKPKIAITIIMISVFLSYLTEWSAKQQH